MYIIYVNVKQHCAWATIIGVITYIIVVLRSVPLLVLGR